MGARLAVEGLDLAYGAILACRNIAFHVEPGEVVTLIGANGAGKSTLLMTLCGNPRAREGRILFDGRDITQASTHSIVRAGLHGSYREWKTGSIAQYQSPARQQYGGGRERSSSGN